MLFKLAAAVAAAAWLNPFKLALSADSTFFSFRVGDEEELEGDDCWLLVDMDKRDEVDDEDGVVDGVLELELAGDASRFD